MTRSLRPPFRITLILLATIGLLGISQAVYAASCAIHSRSGWGLLLPLPPYAGDPSALAPCDPLPTPPPTELGAVYGTTTLPNPAPGYVLPGTADDPLAAFSRRPLDHFIIPEGGLFLDQNDDGPHFGVDYANPDDYLDGKSTLVYPIGPGFVTARADCWRCFITGDAAGRIETRSDFSNFGFGSYVLIETPVNPHVSLYVMYSHLGRDWTGLGDYVTPDSPIGVVGSTGYAQEFHIHLEIRYGSPARFWNADFTQQSTLDRWMATLFIDPALLVFPQNHPAMLVKLTEWVAQQPRARDLP